MPAMKNAAPAVISATEGRRGTLEITIGSCAESAISNPFGGRTRGLFNASSFMFVSFEVPLECHEAFPWHRALGLHRRVERSFSARPDRFPELVSTRNGLRL